MIIFRRKFRIFNGLLHHPSCNNHFRSVMASVHSSPVTSAADDPSSPGITSNTSSQEKSKVASMLLHKNVGFPDVFPVAIELLDLTMTNAGDERISNCIERVNALVKADVLKQDLFGQALINISKARDLNGTTFFRENILRCSTVPSVEELGEFKESADGLFYKWIDRFKYLGENSDSAEPPGRSLNRHFDDMAISLTVSDSWLDNVQKAKESLVKILHPQVYNIELYGSCRSGISSEDSDADMACSYTSRRSKQEKGGVIGNLLKEFDGDYIKMESELSDLKRNVVAHSQLRQIFSNEMISWNLKSSANTQLGVQAGYQEVLSDINAMVFLKNFEVTELKSAMMRLRNQRKSVFEDGKGSQYKNQEQVTMTRSGVINIGKALKAKGYLNVQVIQYARVPLVKCRDPIYNLDIDLTVNKEIPIHNSTLIRDYLMSDASGKVKSTALLLKKIMKEEGICDASAGFLSSYSWIVLLLHFLQRHEFLPPFQTVRDKNSFNNRSVFCEDIYVGYSLPKTLPWFYQQRLANVGVAELLIMFTEYIVRCVDIRTDCLTMRGAGETLTKECWREGNQVGRSTPWRLSIEDPFERADSAHSHDLGRSIVTLQRQEIMMQKLDDVNDKLKLLYWPLTPGIYSELRSSVPPSGLSEGDTTIEGTESTEGQDPLKRNARAVRSDSRRAAAKARTRARRASAAQSVPAVQPQRSIESTTAVKAAVKHVTPTQTQSAPAIPSVSTAEPRAAAVVKVLSKSGKKRMNKWVKKQDELKNAVPL